MTVRSVALIRHDLETALAYRAQYEGKPTDDPWVRQMWDGNEREVALLHRELAEALSGDLEISLTGAQVEGHSVAAPFLGRVLDAFQATCRSVMKSLTTEKLRRADVTLAVVGAAPGSFKLMLRAPAAQLELLGPPLIDRSMTEIVDLLAAVGDGTIAEMGPSWAARTDESAVRSFIRLASALASAKGTTAIRWRSADGIERIVRLSSDEARSLTIALAGQVGREVITVIGHLGMAQDRPPKVRLRTDADEYVADVGSEDLLDLVKELLFEEVIAVLVVDMRTSPTTGSPDVDVELVELSRAPDRTADFDA